MAGRVLLVFAAVCILHSTYSTYEHLSHLKSLGRPESQPPFTVVLETLVGLVMGVIGASVNTPPLKEITWASEFRKRKIDEMDSRLGFASYINRGNSLVAKPNLGSSSVIIANDHSTVSL